MICERRDDHCENTAASSTVEDITEKDQLMDDLIHEKDTEEEKNDK